jgi:hypothetical protein
MIVQRAAPGVALRASDRLKAARELSRLLAHVEALDLEQSSDFELQALRRRLDAVVARMAAVDGEIAQAGKIKIDKAWWADNELQMRRSRLQKLYSSLCASVGDIQATERLRADVAHELDAIAELRRAVSDDRLVKAPRPQTR